jgi:Asp/Glu/hydantoin racemase
MTPDLSSFLGILMLDTAFPRVLGDAGNIESYDIPARIRIVSGAGSLDIVKNGNPTVELVAAFCEAAKTLEQDGACAIVSTCGFLISVQTEISNAVKIPVMVSSLSLYPTIRARVGDKKIGILTASKAALGGSALKSADIQTNDVVIEGFEDCEAFSSAILAKKENQPQTINTAKIEQVAIQKSQNMVENNPDLAAILLECGNLPPYAPAIRAATGLPVFSILDGARLICQGTEGLR